MPSLDLLIDRVLVCVRSAERDGDGAAVLSADALEAADDLRSAAAATEPDAGTAARVNAALGALHWARYRAGAAEQDGDLSTALDLFEPLLTVRPDLVPVPVRRALVAASAPETDDLDEKLQYAVLLLSIARMIDEPDLLDDAVYRFRAVLQQQIRDPVRGPVLSDLALALVLRFQRSDGRADLDEAVEAGRRAATLLPERVPEPVTTLSNLGAALRLRFERYGEPEDLVDAVVIGRRAVDAAGLDDAGTARFNLSATLQLRFHASADRADLDLAVEEGRRALLAVPHGDPRSAVRGAALANALQSRYEVTGRGEDLDGAVAAGQEATAGAGRLNNLGNVLAIQGDTTAVPTVSGDEALDEALEVSRAAVTAVNAAGLTPAEQVSHRVNLATRLRDLYRATDVPADPMAATRELRTALDALPAGHPDRATVAGNLGTVRFLDHLRTGDASAADEAVAYWREATAGAGARPSSRLNAAASWGSTLAARGSWDAAAEGYGQAVALVSRMAWRGITRRSREYRLGRTQGLARDAAACALAARQPGSALTWLEGGRAVLWSQLLEARSDLGRLADRRPDLGQRAQALLALLDDEDG